MALTCPQCAVEMNEVKAAATTGYLLALDQCPRCGGIWTDRWEVFPLTTAAVQQLDDVDTAALHASQAANVSTSTAFDCPRCCAHMSKFADPMLPPDARIERCRNCEGMWFNRGELRRFRSRNGQRISSVNVADLDRLAAATTGTTPPTISHLADVMRAPVDDAPDDVRGELAAAAMWVVVRTVLRLLFHL